MKQFTFQYGRHSHIFIVNSFQAVVCVVSLACSGAATVLVKLFEHKLVALTPVRVRGWLEVREKKTGRSGGNHLRAGFPHFG
jgi:hypothetical protein